MSKKLMGGLLALVMLMSVGCTPRINSLLGTGIGGVIDLGVDVVGGAVDLVGGLFSPDDPTAVSSPEEGETDAP